MKKALSLTLAIVLCLLVGSSAVGGQEPVQSTYQSYQEIPGVTQDEIDAIELLKAKYGGFSYAHLNVTESFRLPDGSYAGFTIEVCKLFSDLFQVPFTPSPYDEWADLKRDIDNCTADFSGEFTHTAERAQIYELTTPIAGRCLKAYNLISNPEIMTESDMNGMRVGFLSGAVAIELIANLYPESSFEAVDVPDFADVATMLRAGEIDAFVTDGVADTLFEPFEDIRSKVMFQFVYAPVSIATKNTEFSPIISVINKYLDGGGMETMFRLYREGEYGYKKHRLNQSFTEEERAYLADLKARNAKVNIALQHDAYPASFYNHVEKRYDGAAYDIVTEVSELTGIEFNSDCMPVEKALSDILVKLKSGEVSMMPQLLYSESRKDDYIWSGVSYITTNYALLSKSDYPNLQPFQVYYATVGTVNKSAHEEMFNSFFPDHTKTVVYPSGDTSFDGLERGEIDLLMLSETMLLVQTNYREKLGYKVNLTFNKTLDTLFGFNKDEVILRDIFDKTLAYIDVPDIEEYWLSRAFDYQSKMLRDAIPFIILFVAVLSMALFVVFVFYLKNKRLSRNLEKTVNERTQELKLKTATLEKRLEQQELMATLSQNFISDDDVDEMIYRALKTAGQFLNIGRMLLTRYEDGSLHYQYEWCNPTSDVQRKYGTMVPADNLAEKVIEDFSQRKVTYFKLDEENRDTLTERYKVEGVEAMLLLPVYAGDAFWGVLEFDQCKRNAPWTVSEINLGKMIAGVLSGALTRRNMEIKLVEAKELAEHNSRAKSDFLSRMSHEMRTPMNAIIGMTSIGKNSDAIERKDYCLGKIDTASTHLLGVINDVLDISKIEAGKFELSETAFNLEKMLIRITNVVNFRMEEKGQTFTIKVDPDVPQAIVTDEQRLSQVITNLIGNAVKFTPDNGTIALYVRKLSVESGCHTLQFEVRDNGIGISEEQQKKLFRSFEQGDGSVSRKYGGTGLGLSISKHIVEMMGGKIWVESTLGAGSKFLFNIRAQEGQCRTEPTLDEVDFSALRVMAVDDEEDVREYFVSLANPLGLQCDVAASGAEACEMIDAHGSYDVFFIDWKMDGMDGIELTRWIKNKYSKNSVVIMISSTEWSHIEDDAKQAGVDRFIPKPLFASVIAECIRECMGVRQKTAADDDERGERFDGMRILLAEDVDINREIIAALLEPTGIQIDCAEDGGVAYNMFKENPDYDLIFMDIHMPEVDGYTSTKMIRALPDPRAKNVPIIAMTANVFREDIERCLEAGMDSHVGKPIDIEDVMAEIRKYVPKHPRNR